MDIKLNKFFFIILLHKTIYTSDVFIFQLAIAPYKNLPQEIESLKTVLEMRNDEIQKLRNHNTELAKKVGFQR